MKLSERYAFNMHDVVQLDPEKCKNPMFAGCFLVITEIKPAWGVQGYVQALGNDGKPGGRAYYRAVWDEIKYVGSAVWVNEA